MSLEFIIDGYNVTKNPAYHHPQGIKDERFSLLELIKRERLCGSSKNKITIVFDGYSDNRLSQYQDNQADIVFSADISADEKIILLIKKAKNPKILVIVSDDKELVSSARLQGAKTMGVEEFIGYKKQTNSSSEKTEFIKPELTYTQMARINQELKEKWLK